MEGGKSLLITLTAIIIILVVSVFGVFYYMATQNNSLREEVFAVSQQQSQTIGELSNKIAAAENIVASRVLEIKASGTASSTLNIKSSTTSLDQLWNEYKNPALSFSIKIPKKVITSQDETQSVEILESGNAVFITYKGNYYYTNALKRISESTTDLQKVTGGMPWAILIKEVANDNELDSFIKERYGSGCSLDKKKESAMAGTFDVTVKGDGKDLGETKCPLNYIVKIKYSPTLKKAATWDLGQSYNFEVKGAPEADMIMSDSFKFIK